MNPKNKPGQEVREPAQKLQVAENASSKLTNDQVDEMLLAHYTGTGYRRLAKMFGVSRSTVRRHVHSGHARAILGLLKRNER